MVSEKPIKLDALAIAAHRDDIEITCGGLLIKLADLGYKTGGYDLTQGEMGTLGDEKDRAAEADRGPVRSRPEVVMEVELVPT